MEIGYWLSEDQWQKGIAAEAFTAFSDWKFDRFDSLLRMEDELFKGNMASGRVLGKAGFAYEGRHEKGIENLGNVMDTVVYSEFK